MALSIDAQWALSRRTLLRLAGVAAGAAIVGGGPSRLLGQAPEAESSRATYRDLERFIRPGADGYAGEARAMQIRNLLETAIRGGQLPLHSGCVGWAPQPVRYQELEDSNPDGLRLQTAVYNRQDSRIAEGWAAWVRSLGAPRRITIYVLPQDAIRYEVAGENTYRVGWWTVRWQGDQVVSFEPQEEHLAQVKAPLFRDVTGDVLGGENSFREQLSRGVPYWRSRLDPSLGLDIYGSNGIAVGDIDGDGRDEVYVCQPGGLPNRLYKFDEHHRMRDVTEQWNVGLLDETSCALFLDLRNIGQQDLVVLRSAGPLLFLNEGKRFTKRDDAFAFGSTPLGGFTGMAAADYDRDGKLDLYLCCYVYFQSEAQFTYPAPYHDAQNGPPNFLFRNQLTTEGGGNFVDVTAGTGMSDNNNRFSFAPAWCDFNEDGWPDLYVANDFGRKNLYVNRDGHFHDGAKEAGVEDIGPGMSASWFDYDGDGRADLYVANMWSDAGQRVIADPQFRPSKEPGAAEAYQRHTRGNSLYRNRGDGTFADVTGPEGAGFGRWAWASAGADWDNDGKPELFGTCGMLTNRTTADTDLMSFFWRQVVSQSPDRATTSSAYQNGWNAINQFIREEYSWEGHEPNVYHVRRGSRYYDCSGVSGLDVAEDGRAFAICDFDGDGRPDLLLKSRLGAQVRVFQNNCASSHYALAIRLEGKRSNRDAIGAKVIVDGQAKWLDAGSGFLSQDSKRLIFGLGAATGAKRVQVRWPSGLEQEWPGKGWPSGFTYYLREGEDKVSREPFRVDRSLNSDAVKVRNDLALDDAWFLQAVPLPEKQDGPCVLILSEEGVAVPTGAGQAPYRVLLLPKTGEKREQYEIFRRYLFDWRTTLQLPQALLLNNDGHVVKFYGQVPDQQQCRSDLTSIPEHASKAIPFGGFYQAEPHRDFAKFGIAYLIAGYPSQGLPYLEQVLRRRPDDSRILVLVGQIHMDRREYAQAQAYFQRVVDSPAASAEAVYGLGAALARQDRLADAQTLLQKALEMRPDFGEAANDLGTLFVRKGQLADAEAAFRYGIRISPDDDILYLNLGRVLIQQGRPEQARSVMEELLDRKPNSQIARRALAELGR